MSVRLLSRAALATATLTLVAIGPSLDSANARPGLSSERDDSLRSDTNHDSTYYDHDPEDSAYASNTQIPEPGTWGLLVAGGALLAGQALARRRKSLAQNG